MKVSKHLRAQKAKLVNDASELLRKPEPTAEDMSNIQALIDRADAFDAQIATAERAETMEAELAIAHSQTAERRGVSPDQVKDEAQREKRLLTAWMAQSTDRLSDADLAIVAQRQKPDARFSNAASVGTSTAGGYTVAPAWSGELLIAQKAYGGVRGVARSIVTETGAALPFPTLDDTANVATIVGENTAGVAGTDLVFGTKSMGAYMYRSGYLPLSLELLQDSAFDFDSLVQTALARRFAYGQNVDFTTGAGTAGPQGAVTGAALGVTAAGTVDVTYAELVALQHSIDPAYRQGASWQMHDSTLKYLRTLTDTLGRPLWGAMDLMTGAQLTLLGAPIVINQQMASMAAGAKSILYGNFSNYLIRDVMGLRIVRLNERFAENGQVAFIAFQRTDGRLISAAQPIVYLKQAAS